MASDLLLEIGAEEIPASFIGLQKGAVDFVSMDRWPELVDNELQRPQKQWWMNLRHIARMMAAPPEEVEY